MEGKKKSHRRYDREFKVEAARLALSDGHTIKEVSDDLGVHYSVLRRWIREYREDAEGSFPGKGRLPADQEELRKVQRENARLRQERDILKKALAIFSRPH